jgi:hypothetical protein
VLSACAGRLLLSVMGGEAPSAARRVPVLLAERDVSLELSDGRKAARLEEQFQGCTSPPVTCCIIFLVQLRAGG